MSSEIWEDKDLKRGGCIHCGGTATLKVRGEPICGDCFASLYTTDDVATELIAGMPIPADAKPHACIAFIKVRFKAYTPAQRDRLVHQMCVELEEHLLVSQALEVLKDYDETI